MRAVWVVLVAGFRRQWRSWLLLSLLIAVASGFVLASTAAGRRTDSAFPRYVASHGYDAIVYTVQPLPKLAAGRGVAGNADPDAVLRAARVLLPPPDQPGRFLRPGGPADGLGRVVKLVSGRMPDQASLHEALASFTLQRDYGIGPGTVIRLPMAAASQRRAVLKALAGGPVPKPAGPTIALRVVGIVAAESEFPSGQGATYDLYPTQGLRRRPGARPPCRPITCGSGTGRPTSPGSRPAASGVDGAGVQDLERRRRRSRPRSALRPSAGGCSPRWPGWPPSRWSGRRWPGRPPRRTPTIPCCPRWAWARGSRRADHAADPGRGAGRRGGRDGAGHAAVAVRAGGRGAARRTRAGADLRLARGRPGRGGGRGRGAGAGRTSRLARGPGARPAGGPARPGRRRWRARPPRRARRPGRCSASGTPWNGDAGPARFRWGPRWPVRWPGWRPCARPQYSAPACPT